MSQKSLSEFLDLVEQKFNEVSVFIASGEPEQLSAQCHVLQQLSVELMETLTRREFSSQRTPKVHLRLVSLAHGISQARAQMLRRAAYVDQALAIVVPTESLSTYGKSSSPYGAVARQSGAFKVLAA
jgi:hypothetical protein